MIHNQTLSSVEDGAPFGAKTVCPSICLHGAMVAYIYLNDMRGLDPVGACSNSQVQTFDDNSAAEIVSTVGRDLLTRLECGLRQNLGRHQPISAAGSIGMASLWPLNYRGPKPHRLGDDETCLVSRA